MLETMFTGYRVCDFMTRKPAAVSPDTSAVECAQHMQKHGIHALAVKKGSSFMGLITEQVLVHEVVANQQKNAKASDVMISDVPTVGPERDILTALKKMRDLDVRQLPVLDPENDNKLVGLLTVADFFKIQSHALETMAERLELHDKSRQSESAQMEGTCDNCGTFSEKLYDREGDFVCSNCRTA